MLIPSNPAAFIQVPLLLPTSVSFSPIALYPRGNPEWVIDGNYNLGPFTTGIRLDIGTAGGTISTPMQAITGNYVDTIPLSAAQIADLAAVPDGGTLNVIVSAFANGVPPYVGSSVSVNSLNLSLAAVGPPSWWFPGFVPANRIYTIRRLLITDMLPYCRIAHTPIVSQLAGVSAISVGYQIIEDYEADFLFLSPGRFIDTVGGVLSPINSIAGIRIYRGVFANRGWVVPFPTNPGIPSWCTPADQQSFIPIEGAGKVSALIEFYFASAPNSASIEFALQPFKER